MKTDAPISGNQVAPPDQVAWRPIRGPGTIQAGAGIAVALYILVTTLLIIRTAYFALPLFDNWDHWRLFVMYGHYSSFLFNQHNEHRIALPRLFFLIDHYLFGARSVFVLVCNFLFQTTTGIWICVLAKRTGRWSTSSSLLLAALVFSAVFSAQQFTNLTWGFQIQFTLIFCMALSAVIALVRAAERFERDGRPEVWLAVSCVCALAGSYSMANGLLIWPILILLSIWLRLPLRYRIILAVDMLLVGFVYTRAWFTPPGHISPWEALRDHFLGVILFAAAYLGAPSDTLLSVFPKSLEWNSENARLTLAVIAGLAGVFIALFSWIAIWRHRERFTKASAALIHVAAFVLLTSASVGLGRVNFPLIEATTSRYRTPALLFWVTLAALYWLQIERRLTTLTPVWRHVAYSGFVFWMIAGLALAQPPWLEYSRDYAQTVGTAEAAIVADVYDEPVWKIAYHSPLTMFDAVDYLRRNNLSVFAEPWTSWTGKPMGSLFTIGRPDSCIGTFDAIVPLVSTFKPGWRVSGWAWDRTRQTGPRTILLVDDTQAIVGVARNLTDRFDVFSAVPEVKTARAGWSGYLSGTGTKSVTAYLVEDGDRSVCKLGTLTTKP